MKNLINYLSKKSLSLGNGSGMTWKWFGNDSGMTRFSLASLICLCMLTVGVGNAWGAAVPSQAPANGKSFIIALYYNNKYYALPHLSSTGSTPAGLECTLNASNKVTAISTCDSPDECLWDFATASGGFYISYDNEGTEVYLYKNGTTGDNYKISATSSYKSNSIWAFTSGTANSVTAYSVKTTKSTATKHTVLRAKSNTSFQVSGTSNVYAITLLEVAETGPTITTSVSSLSDVGYSTDDFSQQVKSFTVSGSSLTENVTVTAPTNYEVCKTSGGTYTSSVSFDKGSGTLAASTVYVRLQSGKTAGNYSGNVACSSSGATTKNVAVSGSVPFTVTWKANGTTHATTYVTYATGEGTAIGTLPDDPDAGDYCGDIFYGWYDGASYSHASVAPSIIGTSTKITSDKTYVAVFADEEDGGTTTVYKLVSSLTNAKDYVFVTRNTAGSGYALSSSVTTGTSVTITTSGDDKIVSGTPANTIIWTAATGWNLQNKNTSTYLVINGGSFGLNASAGTLYWSTDYGLYGKSGSGKTSYYVQCSTGTFSKSESGSTTNRVWAYEKTTVSVKTHTNFKTTCCTSLGTINGSVNLTTSSTGTSVTVSVNTDGVNAYGDANNVSGYDFKLYTASAGGSAAATYSSDSKAGTSHTFTGLTPLTQYWVTVRPIGSGSYCNTTAESDRVAIYTCPGSPNHVDVSGRWDRFGGETISLTAAAYATAGTGTAIPAAKITGYQWQKYYNSIWNDISNGGTISGATTNNLQITNCSNENSGSYRCVVSTVAGCDIASDGFQVKVYALECYNSGTTVYNFTRTGDTQAGTVQIDLSASTNYGYKVHADNDYYGNSGTVNEDVTNWEMSTGVSNNLTVASGLGGTFTFAIDYSTGGNNSTEGIPEISVTYPRKTIYLTPGVWNSGEAKFAFYYFRKVGETIYGEGFTDFITADDCGSSAEIPLWNGVKINAVRLNSNTTASDLTNSANHYKAAWDKKWNQTSDITITSNNSISITGWGPDNGDSPYDYGTYAVPTYTISYATGSVPTGGGSISGSKANETKTCGVDFDLPAAQFTTTGYVQTGWSKADGGAQYAAVSGSYTDNSAQTFYPVWTANTHTLTWDKNGGDALTGDYTSGTVAYATAITAPNTPTWTGHTFGGWHNGTSIVTPATTMPDNDLSYTAQWSLATYTVTLNTNGGTINAGDVDEYTYGTGATLPTNVTRDGYRFDGWFTDDGVWSDQVTAISTTATGDKTYYAKWTQVYTVTWSVNGETWSSGVVEGNTHVPGGSKVSALPTAPTSSECDDAKVFVGWRSTAIDGVSAANPGSIFTTKAASPAITGDVTFYAVFADESGGDFTRVTSTSQLAAGKQIVMGYEETANSGIIIPVQSNTYNSDKNILYTGTTNGAAGTGTITISSNPDVTNYLFTLRAGYNSGYWAFEMSGTLAGEYIGYSGKNTIQHYEGIQTDGKTDFSITFGTNDTASIVNKYGTANYITESGKNKYYKYVSYNYNNGNPRVSIYQTRQTSALVLYICNPLVYSNYVTSCSSCDADATYTNTTPTVSEIECTDATLTMPEGLATLGGEGCNISDYGFVIGTSDNPAVGGDGVTKFQVGTSNPTLGNDFSYNATGLTKGTRYYIRAYAINRHGTAYSTNSQNFWTKNVSSIAITTAPTKTNYIVGETFDATGMVVTATMASGSTEDVTSAVTYSTDPLTAGANKNFAINYTLCETDKSVNQKINVYTLSVSEGDNPTYGDYSVSGAVITVTPGAQKTFSFVTTNCSTRDNGDGTYTVINVTGNATVVINYRDAIQVKVYYKVDGTTITSLTQDVYESSQTTLPTASALSSAMAAQGMALPDELYPNFIGWSETEFGAQTEDPTIIEGTPIITASKSFYAVYSNVEKIRIDESDITSTSYPGSEQTLTKSSKDFKYYDICKNSTYYLQFKKTNNSYIYNNTAISNIVKIEVGASDTYDAVAVYAGSAANTISGSKLTDEDIYEDKYVYLFPSNTQYFIIKGNSSYTYRVNYIDIFYASSTVYYMTQFCTRYDIDGASTSGTAVIVNGNTGGTLTSSHNALCEGKSLTLSATVNTQYSFGEWKIVKTGSDPEVDLTADLLGANKTSLTPPAFSMPGYGITVSATISEKTATAWSWTYNSAAIPDPMILYVGEIKKLDVTYTPDASQLVSTQKNYSVTKESSPVAEHAKAMNYYKMRGAAGVTEETNATVTFSLNSLTQVVNVTVRPLPSATFEDNVHNAISTTVTATVTDGVVELTKKTPTHADISPAPASGNSCEKAHLHLVGWIDGDWEPFINYMNGGSRPSDSDITSATGYFFLPNADIDLSQKGGKTYYAVWGKADE